MDALPVPLLDQDALQELAQARQLLEHPGVAARLANVLGAPIESLLVNRLPGWATRRIDGATRLALKVAMRSALLTLRSAPRSGGPATARHKAAVMASGAAGGFFGLAGLLWELPLTTTLMLRSIADIARSQGESLEDPETVAACLEVLAHGSPRADDDGSETGYFAVRTAMAQQVNAAVRHLASHGLSHKGAPVLLSLLTRVASRFSTAVGEKAVAQAVPLMGAASGAALNAVFLAHFQAMARGHFTVRRLERRYGQPAVRQAWEALPPPAR